MKYLLNLHYMVSLHLIIVVVVIMIAAWVVHEDKESIRLELQSSITDQTIYLKELLEMTDRNEADDTAARIITDCPNRSEFERKLGNLGTLNNRDLVDVQQYFENCGYYYAERKALMVSKIEREYDVLKKYMDFLLVIDETAQDDLVKLEQVIELEKKRNDLLAEQTDIQSEIISSLISGKTVSSNEITNMVVRARTINESLSVLNKQIDDSRDGALN